jgi:hypothetical protein
MIGRRKERKIMSKQFDAKLSQSWQKKFQWPVCGNCSNFKFDLVDNGYGYKAEKELRCSIGGFKVGRMDTCKRHAAAGNQGCAPNSLQQMHGKIIAAM